MKKQFNTPVIIGMRDSFFEALYPIFLEDKKTVLISADNGAPSMDQISLLPGQFRNVGIAEEQMIGMACGFALEGRHVWVYAIDPFATLRCLEFVKVDICVMDLPVKILGVGAGYAYDIMGPTHHAVGVISAMRPWPNLKIYSPADSITASALAKISYEDKHPQYIRFDRAGIPDLYQNNRLQESDLLNGLKLAAPVQDGNVCIISTGIMVHQALKVAHELGKKGIRTGVIDLFRLKPVNKELLLSYLACFEVAVTLEEDFVAGGLGSIIAEIFIDEGLSHIPLLRIGQEDRFVFELGGREVIWKKSGLDVTSVTKRIIKWLEYKWW